jgi:predicted metal-dependent hydrolase
MNDGSIRLVANPRARRYIARVMADGALRVTIPRFGNQAEALRFADRIGSWVQTQQARRVALPPPELWPPPTPAWLARARRELVPRVGELAHQHGLRVTRVSIRRQRSRWGSCSRRGAISLNWRLVHAPPHVRDYVIVHELMHLREMNHSARFWAHVDAAFPERDAAEQWLKTHAPFLST